MSDKEDKTENPFADSMNSFRGMYDAVLKQTSEQWEDIARNPLFVAQMANNFEQTMQVQKQLRDLLETSLDNLDLPGKEDILLLAERINKLRKEIAEVNGKLDLLLEKPKKKRKKKKNK